MNRGATLITPFKMESLETLVTEAAPAGPTYVRSAAQKSIPHGPLPAPSTADSL